MRALDSVLDSLRLVPLEALLLHEAVDDARLSRLVERVHSENVQRNPVIVTPLPPGGSSSGDGPRYLVLDGAHRASALSALKCELLLAQVVGPEERLESWSHLVEDPTARRMLELDAVSVSRSEALSGEPGAEPFGEQIAGVEFADGERARLFAGSGCSVAGALRQLQEVYPGGEPVERVEDPEPVLIPEGGALIRYRRFGVEDLSGLVASGEVLPAGITRFVFRERILNVSLPLVHLKGGDPEERDAELRSFIAEARRRGGVRRYTEPVVLFE